MNTQFKKTMKHLTFNNLIATVVVTGVLYLLTKVVMYLADQPLSHLHLN